MGEAGSWSALIRARSDEAAAWVERLLSKEPVAIDGSLRSHLPEQLGIYAFSMIGQPLDVVRAGRAAGANGLRQRVYQNHLMGNQTGNLRAQLVGAGRCGTLDEAKDWIRGNCEVRFVVTNKDTDIRWIEHFMLAVLRPEFSD